jgi:cell shape-determining protein MreC
MTYDPHDTRSIPIGTPVVAYNGELLGKVREVHPHYILVDQEGEHDDFDVPVHAIQSFENGKLQVSVNRWAATEVDHEETVHRLREDPK